MNKKRLVLISIFLIVVIFILFFLIHYKIRKNGNTINKSTEDITNYILNISSYEAQLEITVESNKTTNQYQVKQFYSKPNRMKQIVEEPSNLKNLTITYDGTNMKIENTQLSLSKIYEQYEYINQNTLWLSSFIDNYNEESKVKELENEIIIENDKMFNVYNVKQILYIDKKIALPTKLEIFDNNKNKKVYIKYKEIKFNQIKQNDIIAFHIQKTKWKKWLLKWKLLTK